MTQLSERSSGNARFTPPMKNPHGGHVSILLCNWHILRRQLLQQWELLAPDELDVTGPDCRRIANLIARKYGVFPKVVENYLRNFERTLPLL